MVANPTQPLDQEQNPQTSMEGMEAMLTPEQLQSDYEALLEDVQTMEGTAGGRVQEIKQEIDRMNADFPSGAEQANIKQFYDRLENLSNKFFQLQSQNLQCYAILLCKQYSIF